MNDDYLAIATLGIAEAARLFFLNEKWVANGSKGLYRIPEFLGDWVSPDQYDYIYVIVVVVILAALFAAIQRAVSSPWGRVLRAIREDEVAAEASGKNVFNFKLQSFVFGAVIMGIGGALYASPHPVPGSPHFRSSACDIRHMGHAHGRRYGQ